MQRALSRAVMLPRRALAAALTNSVRWESHQATPVPSSAEAAVAMPTTTATGTSGKSGAAGAHPRADTNDAHHTMDHAAEARREIAALWQQCSEAEARQTTAPAAGQTEADASRLAAVEALLDKYRIDMSTPREADVCRGLGDALDRLLLLCVPLPPASTESTAMLERVLNASARQGRKLHMRTVQHLFARTSHFAEALAIFYALRQCHFAMSIEAYHAMLYSLQRLEEEGWAERFHEEYTESKGQFISEQALDFVLRGVDNQLLPENKPWLGRVMFAETDNAAAQKQSLASFDEMGKLWVNRYTGANSI